MAPVRLTDAYIADVYGSYTAINNVQTSEFLSSGVVVRNSLLDAIARDGGTFSTVPFWNDIDPALEPNYSNDDPADLATANKITAGTMMSRKAWLNQGFGEMDLVVELAGSSPMQHIRNRFGTYWQRQMQRRLIASALGVMADNIANDSGDMVEDISAGVGAAAVFNRQAFVDAAYTLGDQVTNLGAVAVHSATMAVMVANDDVIYIPDSKGQLVIPTYMGKRIIVDDSMPVATGVYTSIIFGGGAFGFGGIEGSAFAWGEGAPKVPFEVWRQPQAGNGGGMEEIWERNTWILHPFGFSWVEGTLVEKSPTLADLALAAHWNRVVARKAVPMAFLKAKVA